MLHTLKAGSTGITDGGLHMVMKACPNLQHLELNRCELTDQGIKYFVKELSSLKFLDLTGVAGISAPLMMEI